MTSKTISSDEFRKNGHFYNFFIGKKFTDVKIITQDLQEIEAHRLILASASGFFLNVLENHTSTESKITFFLNDVDFKDCFDLLRFVYSGKLEIEESRIEKIKESAEKLGISLEDNGQIKMETKDFTDVLKEDKEIQVNLKVEGKPLKKEDLGLAPMEDGKWQCMACSAIFANRSNANRHFKQKHEVEEGHFPCPRCEEVFTQKAKFHNHLMKMHQISPKTLANNIKPRSKDSNMNDYMDTEDMDEN